jgi:hypothetical protein
MNYKFAQLDICKLYKYNTNKSLKKYFLLEVSIRKNPKPNQNVIRVYYTILYTNLQERLFYILLQ